MEISHEGEPLKPQKEVVAGTLNREFKMLRVKSGLTQKQVEAITGIGASKISYFENNLEKPDDAEAALLGDAYHCSAEQVIKLFPKNGFAVKTNGAV